MSGKKITFGLILVFLGLFFLFRSIGIIDWDFGDFVSFMLPVGLIAFGVWMIVRRKPPISVTVDFDTTPPPPPPPGSDSTFRASTPGADIHLGTSPPPPPGGGHRFDPPPSPPPPPGSEQSGSQSSQGHQYKYSYEFTGQPSGPQTFAGGRMKYSKFAGDNFIDCNGLDLRNIEVSSFAGNNEIKLHGGKLSAGLNRLVVSGFIGDVRILVPQGMPVLCTSSSFIGDVELLGKRTSGLGNTIDARTENYDSAEAKLYIAVNHFIGDVRVYVV